MATWIKSDGSIVDVQPKGRRFSLEELQQLVGGYIELSRIFNGLEMYVNEEGKPLGLPLNLTATLLHPGGFADHVVGDVVVLTPEETEREKEE